MQPVSFGQQARENKFTKIFLLILGIVFFGVFYFLSLLYNVGLDHVFKPEHYNIAVVAIYITFIAFFVLGHFFSVIFKVNIVDIRKVPSDVYRTFKEVGWGNRISLVMMIAELFLLFYLALINLSWEIVFLALPVHAAIHYKLYGGYIKKRAIETYGEEVGVKYISALTRGLSVISTLYITIPLLNLAEILFSLFLLNAFHFSILLLGFLLPLIIIQDIFLLRAANLRDQ